MAQIVFVVVSGPPASGKSTLVRPLADELWNEEVIEPLAGGWPVLEVDTNRAVDLADPISFIRTSSV